MRFHRGKHTYGPTEQIIGRPSILEGSSIGNFCSIAENLQIIAKGRHVIEWVSTYPFFEKWGNKEPINPNLPISDAHIKPVKIGNDVWIASNVKIKQGVTIGDGAVLATESFVTKDVPPYAVVGGNPARIIKYRFSEQQIKDLLEIKWWYWEDSDIKKISPLLIQSDIDKFISVAKEMLKL